VRLCFLNGRCDRRILERRRQPATFSNFTEIVRAYAPEWVSGK
jgi:hypothetical protein